MNKQWRSALKWRLLGFVIGVGFFAQSGLAQTSNMEVCQLADQVVKEGLRSGRTLASNEIGWAIRFEAAAKRNECPTPPESLLGKVPSNAAADIGPEPKFQISEARAQRDRWEAMFEAATNLSVGEQLQFGWVGFAFEPQDETVPFNKASELEALSAEIGADALTKFGSRFQFRERKNVDAYCAALPGSPGCAAQSKGIAASWEAAMLRKQKSAAAAEDARLAALTPAERAYEEALKGDSEPVPTGSYAATSTPASALVTLRVYDQYGNYQGSTLATSTEASLLGAK